MKYLVGVLLVIVIAGGVLLGFNLGKNRGESNNTSTSPTESTTTSNTQSSSKAVVLDLSNQNITKVTSDIYSKTATTELLLSYNSIKTLPSEMGKMTNLVVFKIDHNVLDGSLIAEVRQMAKLKQLDVSYNNMTGMPAEIGQLNNLEVLNYSYNSISGLPSELANLKNNLKEFNLTGNPLSQDQINTLKAQLPNTNIIF